MDTKSKLHHQCGVKVKLNGYVALIVVLAISVMLTVIGVSIALISINQGDMSTVEQKKEAELSFVESCAADALMKLDKYRAIPSIITLPLGTCSVITSRTGFDWVITVSGSQENYTKTIQINASRTTSVDVTSWTEI